MVTIHPSAQIPWPGRVTFSYMLQLADTYRDDAEELRSIWRVLNEMHAEGEVTEAELRFAQEHINAMLMPIVNDAKALVALIREATSEAEDADDQDDQP